MQRHLEPGLMAEQSQSTPGATAPISTTTPKVPKHVAAEQNQSTPATAPLAQPHYATLQEQNSPDAPAQSPILEGAADEPDHDDSRASKRAKTSNETGDSSERAEFDPIPESISQANIASQEQPADVESRIFFYPHLNNGDYTIPGLYPGDIIKAVHPEPLENLDLLEIHPELARTINGNHWLFKDRYWLVLSVSGCYVGAHRLTSLGDPNLDRLREETVNDETLGLRYKVADYVQMIADHFHNGLVEPEPETRCYDNGKTLLHWEGSIPPPKKVTFFPLIECNLITIGHSGAELMGQITEESFRQFRRLKARIDEACDRGTARITKRCREWKAALKAAEEKQSEQ
jgi:hypothetical protein